MAKLTFDQAEEILLNLGVSQDTITTVCNINGHTFEQLENILYATQGYQSFSQLEGYEDDEDEDEENEEEE